MKKSIFKSTYLILLILAIILLPSCLKDTYNDKLNQEKEEIKQYMTSHGLKPKKEVNNSLYIVENTPGTGDTVKSYNDYALIRYRASLLSGKIFDSTDTIDFSTLKNNGYYPYFGPGGPLLFSLNTSFTAMSIGLSSMREGGKSTFIMSSVATGLGDFTPRVYEVELIKIYHDITTTRKNEFSNAMTAIGFNLSDSISSGLFYKIDSTSVKPSAVRRPKNGDTVVVKYAAKLIDSVYVNTLKTRYAYSEDFAVLIVGNSNIYTFQQILPKMKIGMKANVYVPTISAFGSYGLSDFSKYSSGQMIIPPYTNLMYENVELLGYAKKSNVGGVLQWIIDDSQK